MSALELLPRILALASDIAGPTGKPVSLGPETLLADGGFWLDSVGLLELVLACEREFGVILDPAQDLSPATLHSVRSLASAIAAKLAS
jgi:acyl carrier protein